MGVVDSPPSRAAILLLRPLAAELLSGKYFPLVTAGRDCPHSDDASAVAEDAPNDPPPRDGLIASAGRPEAGLLDTVRDDWFKSPVTSGQRLPIHWDFDVRGEIRRVNYFLTRHRWDPARPLSRAQFEPEPFDAVVRRGGIVSGGGSGVAAAHEVVLPDRPAGYHVLLAVCEFADRGDALYQVIDLRYRDGTPPA